MIVSDLQVLPPHNLHDIIREDRLPHILCPGCGIGIVIGAIARAIKELNLDLSKIVIVSGIGCSGRASMYFKTDAFHTTHGRALPLATAIKIARPELKVIVIAGDGDLFAIGGNHFIHAARRNINLTVICINNFNYGMTGGQEGPTTPIKSLTSTSPYGSMEHPFNLVALAASAGATYVARWTVAHVNLLTKSIKRAIQKKGLSFIDVLSPCPTYYGRYNRIGTTLDIMNMYLKLSRVKSGIPPQNAILDLHKEIIVGEFVDVEKPEFSELLHKFVDAQSNKLNLDK